MWLAFGILAICAAVVSAVAIPNSKCEKPLRYDSELMEEENGDTELLPLPEAETTSVQDEPLWLNNNASNERKKKQVAQFDQETAATRTAELSRTGKPAENNTTSNVTEHTVIVPTSEVKSPRQPANAAIGKNETLNQQWGNGSVILRAGQFLAANTSYYSPSRTYRLILQTDQNLVLYRKCDGRAVWASETVGLPPLRAVLNSDGHFVLGSWGNNSDHLERSYWSTETWGYGESRLLLSDQGYFYLCNDEKGCYWRSSRSTGTESWQCGGWVSIVPAESLHYRVIVKVGNDMELNISHDSPNRKFSLALSRYNKQQLVVWRGQDSRITFKAAAQKNISHIRLQEDGNLVIYSLENQPLWSSITNAPNYEYENPELRLYDDGFLYLCDNRGCYWQSSGFLDVVNANIDKRLSFLLRNIG
ncbi:uncharacterized protein LOC129601097 isoform X2 [Paramacrobiotus metropolitanus]|uniref:uncharacterized protein LOC129601097 isoform X2 n=1 Tax=Paramacrobiotus metropolitanus TaxID=2943436 RepID=UPI00244625B6|nr:uncharacterized protein LOC129601097 isoform X2 [Paramacrobiotus metropolitanus]